MDNPFKPGSGSIFGYIDNPQTGITCSDIIRQLGDNYVNYMGQGLLSKVLSYDDQRDVAVVCFWHVKEDVLTTVRFEGGKRESLFAGPVEKITVVGGNQLQISPVEFLANPLSVFSEKS